MPTFEHKVSREQIEVNPNASRIGRMRRRVFSWGELSGALRVDLPFRTRSVMVSLTYHGYTDWGEFIPNFGWQPNQIRDYVAKVKRALLDDLVAIAWTAELQARGAVHYHVLFIIRHSASIPTPDTSGMWQYGTSNVKSAKTAWYIAKYATKAAWQTSEGDWINFPKHLRLFSVWLNPFWFDDPRKRWIFRLSALPVYLSDLLATNFIGWKPTRPDPGSGGGWLISDGSDPPERVFSPWRLVSI